MIAKTHSDSSMHTFHINEENFVSSFAVLIYSLNLKHACPKQPFSFNKSHPYSFDVATALSIMHHMELKLDLLGSHISYSFSKDAALTLLKKYFAAHLLHNPATRTASTIGSAKVQVTPKGTAIVYGYYKAIGLRIEQMPEIVKSNFNTMELFRFERSASSNRAIYSKFLCQVLVKKMLGPRPNVWSSAGKPSPIRDLFSLDCQELASRDNAFNFEELGKVSHIFKNESPFHHRYFSNPESDAYIHYYQSEAGMRVFEKREFKSSFTFHFCFSGKAFVQWLCDCTTLYSAAEAVELGQLMLDYGIITPIMAEDQRFANDRGVFYTVTDFNEYCDWPTQASDALPTPTSFHHEEQSKELFKKLLSDPGMRYVFRAHLERERCSENIDAYFQLRKFQSSKKQISLLLKYYTTATDPDKKQTLQAGLERSIDRCNSMARAVYLKYFSRESSCNLNIDFALKNELDTVIAGMRQGYPVPKTPDDLYEFMKTPVVEKKMDLDSLEQTTCVTSMESQQNSDSSTDDPLIQTGDLEQHERAKEKQSECLEESTSEEDHAEDNPFDKFQQDFDAVQKRDSARFERRTLGESIRALNQVLRCYNKISASIYRLMEVDSYPKFAQSEENRRVMDTLIQW